MFCFRSRLKAHRNGSQYDLLYILVLPAIGALDLWFGKPDDVAFHQASCTVQCYSPIIILCCLWRLTLNQFVCLNIALLGLMYIVHAGIDLQFLSCFSMFLFAVSFHVACLLLLTSIGFFVVLRRIPIEYLNSFSFAEYSIVCQSSMVYSFKWVLIVNGIRPFFHDQAHKECTYFGMVRLSGKILLNLKFVSHRLVMQL